MKLKEYLALLHKLATEKPETLNMEVFTGIDDEGNGYNPILFAPGIQETKYLDNIDTKDTHVVVVN